MNARTRERERERVAERARERERVAERARERERKIKREGVCTSIEFNFILATNPCPTQQPCSVVVAVLQCVAVCHNELQ